MPDYKEEISRREKADAILLTDKSTDVKLYEIFQLYKEDLKKSYPQLYYSMLEWKDRHLHELLKETSKKKQ